MPKNAKGSSYTSQLCRCHLRQHALVTAIQAHAFATCVGTKGVGRRGTHSHKSRKTHKLGLRATFLERHIDQVHQMLGRSLRRRRQPPERKELD